MVKLTENNKDDECREFIEDARLALGMKYCELAEYIGITTMTLWNYRTGKYKIPKNIRFMICNALAEKDKDKIM